MFRRRAGGPTCRGPRREDAIPSPPAAGGGDSEGRRGCAAGSCALESTSAMASSSPFMRRCVRSSCESAIAGDPGLRVPRSLRFVPQRGTGLRFAGGCANDFFLRVPVRVISPARERRGRRVVVIATPKPRRHPGLLSVCEQVRFMAARGSRPSSLVEPRRGSSRWTGAAAGAGPPRCRSASREDAPWHLSRLDPGRERGPLQFKGAASGRPADSAASVGKTVSPRSSARVPSSRARQCVRVGGAFRHRSFDTDLRFDRRRPSCDAAAFETRPPQRRLNRARRSLRNASSRSLLARASGDGVLDAIRRPARNQDPPSRVIISIRRPDAPFDELTEEIPKPFARDVWGSRKSFPRIVGSRPSEGGTSPSLRSRRIARAAD